MDYEEMLKNDRIKIDIVGLSLNRKELEYRNYIETHRANIAYALIKYNDVIAKAIGIDTYHLYNRLYPLIHNHDKSKYSAQEFDAYRMKFYPIEGVEDQDTEAVDKAFERAWKHHYRCNKHHPEYWIDHSGEPKKMHTDYIVEMALDWVAMSMKHNGMKCYDYYDKVKEDIVMYKESRRMFEQIIYAIEQYDILLGDD